MIFNENYILLKVEYNDFFFNFIEAIFFFFG